MCIGRGNADGHVLSPRARVVLCGRYALTLGAAEEVDKFLPLGLCGHVGLSDAPVMGSGERVDRSGRLACAHVVKERSGVLQRGE